MRMEFNNLVAEFHRAGQRAARKSTPKRLHALRLQGKRLRYTLELLEPLLTDKASSGVKARLKTLKQVQDLLGEINDCQTSLLWLLLSNTTVRIQP